MRLLVKPAREYAHRHWRSHVVAAAAGVFLALVGALGTDAAPWLDRFVFWIVLMQAGSFCAGVVDAIVAHRPRIGESAILRWALITLGVTAPMALLSWGLARVVFAWGGRLELASFASASLLVTGTMTALMMAMGAPGPATTGQQGQADGEVRPGGVKLRERLAAPFRGAEIYAVSAEDHYLRVHTSAGATLLLLRLADALKELDGVEGAQVHRSWWVARAAVVGARRDGRKLVLSLNGGIEAPVSRPNVRAVEESGWLA